MTEKHVHKYRRHTYKSGNSVYFCALPDCSNKIATSLALGKRTICWRCGESFIMTEYSIRLAKPHCQNCHKIKFNLDATTDLMPEPLKKIIQETIVHDAFPAGLDTTLADLRNRLSASSHREIQRKPDDEGDI